MIENLNFFLGNFKHRHERHVIDIIVALSKSLHNDFRILFVMYDVFSGSDV